MLPRQPLERKLLIVSLTGWRSFYLDAIQSVEISHLKRRRSSQNQIKIWWCLLWTAQYLSLVFDVVEYCGRDTHERKNIEYRFASAIVLWVLVFQIYGCAVRWCWFLTHLNRSSQRSTWNQLYRLISRVDICLCKDGFVNWHSCSRIGYQSGVN